MADMPALYAEALSSPTATFSRNQPYIKPGVHQYNTDLGDQEPAFRQWTEQNRVPFDFSRPYTDYDMRGFWQALQQGDPRATSAVNPNDSRMHYPDFWKTPYHETFSNQSQWAGPVAPQWTPDETQLVSPGGRILFDERRPAR